MPLYEYECQQCHRHTEKRQKFSDPEITECPHCGGKLERVISAPNFAFAGGGWYKDLYSSTKPKSGDGSSSDSKSGDTKATDSKPAESKPSSSSEGSSASAPTAAPAAAPSTPKTWPFARGSGGISSADRARPKSPAL